MIKVAITGADSREAGEIIRILVNHPEVELTALSAPGKEGLPVRSIHHGLIGKEDYRFTGSLSMASDCDVIYVCGNSMSAVEFAAIQNSCPDLKIIYLNSSATMDMDGAVVVNGLSEIYRKTLVRGAMCSRVLSPIAVAALVPLYPLALNMLLNDTLSVKVTVPRDILEKDRLQAQRDISHELHNSQLSFDKPVDLICEITDDDRYLEMEITMDCNVSIDQILGIYDMYDDHNFSFAITGNFSTKETEGTPKLVFSVDKPEDDKLKMIVRLDPRMRGGASEAVHNMNLMFALHETTGLEIKASKY